MLQNHLIGRIALSGALGVALLMGATPAKAEAKKEVKKDNLACLSAYESAQERERSGHLVEASQLFLTCARATCGGSLRQECATKNAQLNSRLSSVVLAATDIAGKPLTDVQVTVDGKPFTSRLDARPLPIDPGAHEFSFSIAGKVFASQRITISKDDHSRAISVSQKPAGSNDPKASVSER